jgi:hypothetical protein
MMDFVVSKVAMSICALLVVATLGGMFGEGALLDPKGELERIVDDFCSVVDSIALSRTESGINWLVPFTSNGETVIIQLDGALVRAGSGIEVAVGQPVRLVRTWEYDGCDLNATMLADLDETCTIIEARSGESICLESRFVTLENQLRVFIFASSQA